MKKLLIMALMSAGLMAGSVPVIADVPVMETSIPLYVALGGYYGTAEACCNGCTWDETGYSGMLEAGYRATENISVGVRGTLGFNQGYYAVARLHTNNEKYNVGVLGGYGYSETDYYNETTGLFGANLSYNFDKANSFGVEAVRYNNNLDSVGIFVLHKF